MGMEDMKSKDIGKPVSAELANQGQEIPAAQKTLSGVAVPSKPDAQFQTGSKLPANALYGRIPGTVKNQNLGHNSKKEGLGPNTER